MRVHRYLRVAFDRTLPNSTTTIANTAGEISDEYPGGGKTAALRGSLWSGKAIAQSHGASMSLAYTRIYIQAKLAARRTKNIWCAFGHRSKTICISSLYARERGTRAPAVQHKKTTARPIRHTIKPFHPNFVGYLSEDWSRQFPTPSTSIDGFLRAGARNP